jgi:hypothetical protein
MSDYSSTVTLIATPPPGMAGANNDRFLQDAFRSITGKKATQHRVAKVSSVRDIDLELGSTFSDRKTKRVRLQLIGHTLSGGLALGAFWMPESEVQARAFKFPYYSLDTNPAALGLLSKYAGQISELMLIGCNIGSTVSFGHPINGRTLTYTLAELLCCDVFGADDVIGPDEFDRTGWYAPRDNRRAPKGWRWVAAEPPVWTTLSAEPVARRRVKVA